MSLDYNLGKIKDYKTVCLTNEGDRLNIVTTAIIWATMAVDIGEITEDNYKEFYKRLRLIDTSRGWDSDFTLEDVKAHIGLTTNVLTLPVEEWFKKFYRNFQP